MVTPGLDDSALSLYRVSVTIENTVITGHGYNGGCLSQARITVIFCMRTTRLAEVSSHIMRLQKNTKKLKRAHCAPVRRDWVEVGCCVRSRPKVFVCTAVSESSRLTDSSIGTWTRTCRFVTRWRVLLWIPSLKVLCFSLINMHSAHPLNTHTHTHTQTHSMSPPPSTRRMDK